VKGPRRKRGPGVMFDITKGRKNNAKRRASVEILGETPPSPGKGKKKKRKRQTNSWKRDKGRDLMWNRLRDIFVTG